MQTLRTSSTLNLHKYPQTDIGEHIRQGLVFLKNAGFDAADFPMWILNILDGDWKTEIEKALEASAEIGIKFEVCHLPFTTAICTNPEAIPPFNQKVHNAIDAAAMLGVEYAVLHPNTITSNMDEYDQAKEYDSVMSHLEPFAEHAEKVNVKLAVENMRVVHSHIPGHRYCQNPDELCNVADALGAGICWDFGHANICGLKQSEALSYIGSRLKVLHVNDNKGVGDDHLPPFCGTVDWEDAMKGLASIGFDGLFNYEVDTNHMPLSVRESFAKYLLDSAHEMMNY